MDGGADPQVGFGMTGTAYFVGLKIDSMADSMMFFRSEDGGRTWSKGLNLGKNHDHEMLVTDYTYGPYAGRVYMTDEAGVPGSKEMEDMRMRRRLVLFRSSDDGRSFVGPVEVARSDAAEPSADGDSNLQNAAQREPASLSTGVTLVIDPVSYDRQSKEAVVPISLKNISNQALYPPFQVEVKELAHPFRVKSGSSEDPPTILNATNRKTGVGAVFDYTRTLGDLPALEPGAVTSAIPWRLQAPSPVKTDFHLGVEITGYLEKPQQSGGVKEGGQSGSHR